MNWYLTEHFVGMYFWVKTHFFIFAGFSHNQVILHLTNLKEWIDFTFFDKMDSTSISKFPEQIYNKWGKYPSIYCFIEKDKLFWNTWWVSCFSFFFCSKSKILIHIFHFFHNNSLKCFAGLVLIILLSSMSGNCFHFQMI